VSESCTFGRGGGYKKKKGVDEREPLGELKEKMGNGPGNTSWKKERIATETQLRCRILIPRFQYGGHGKTNGGRYGSLQGEGSNAHNGKRGKEERERGYSSSISGDLGKGWGCNWERQAHRVDAREILKRGYLN